MASAGVDAMLEEVSKCWVGPHRLDIFVVVDSSPDGCSRLLEKGQASAGLVLQHESFGLCGHRDEPTPLLLHHAELS